MSESRAITNIAPIMVGSPMRIASHAGIRESISEMAAAQSAHSAATTSNSM